MDKIIIGAPSLRDATEEPLSKRLASLVFPLVITVTNKMPRDISLPEINVPLLRHVCNSEGLNAQDTQIDNLGQLERAIASMEEISELNTIPQAIVITFPESSAKSTDDKENPEPSGKSTDDKEKPVDATDKPAKTKKGG